MSGEVGDKMDKLYDLIKLIENELIIDHDFDTMYLNNESVLRLRIYRDDALFIEFWINCNDYLYDLQYQIFNEHDIHNDMLMWLNENEVVVEINEIIENGLEGEGIL